MDFKSTEKHEELKRYLFDELSQKEREALENRYFEDSDFFYDLVGLENDLVDSFVHGNLHNGELTRFENSLPVHPDRIEKIANARAIHSLVLIERPAAAWAPTFAEKIALFFRSQMHGFQLATASLAILLAIGSGYLLYQNRQVNQEFAELKKNQAGEIAERERLLQEKIKEAQSRANELETELQGERGQNDAVAEQLANEQAQKLKLERELENLRKEQNKSQNDRSIPTFASIFLLPFTAERGGSRDAKIIPIDANTTAISFSLQIPLESKSAAVSVSLDGAPLAANLKPRRTKSGNRIVNVSIDVKKLGETEHSLTIEGREYLFKLKR